jgi:nucleotide-binding universal stress UspA family protein
MTALRMIVAAVDFSDASARALAVAGSLAEACQARLTLLHAESIEAPVYFTTEQLGDLVRQRRASRAAVEDSVARFGRVYTAAPFSVAVHDDTPIEAIVHASAAADLVVIGTHDRHGPARWWLGSVAERALQEVSKPLLIVRSAIRDPIGELFARVVVHATAGTSGHQALEYARALVDRCGGAVHDERGMDIEEALRRTRATLVITASAHQGHASGASNDAERLLRSCTVPILFVPEFTEGGTSS